MAVDVQFTDEFEEWWNSLRMEEQVRVDTSVSLLAEIGPTLGRPHVDTLNGSSLANLKELRVQNEGRPLRVFFAFDPSRAAILLIGGDKTGNKRFYKEMIPKAESIFAQYLRELHSRKG